MTRKFVRRTQAACAHWLLLALLVCSAVLPAMTAHAEDGYDLWLRYHLLPDAAQKQGSARELVVLGATPTLQAAGDELQRGLHGLLGVAPTLTQAATRDGAIVLGTAQTPQIAALGLATQALGREGYLIRSTRVDGHQATVIVGGSDVGVLYGAFHLLRLVQTGQSLSALNLRQTPRLQLRLLNHWDNLDGVVERGYAGASLWNWQTLPGYLDPRYTDYARANASLGINGTVLNNVNAKAWSLTPQYLDKAAALATVFRPYGIRVFLSARFSAPIEIGGLKTADPLDPQVQRWWRETADAIYARIPDFGGFLVKANSEGQPGPQDYGRSHADGANLLADALAPHGGVVMWRAFVYSHEQPDDRAKQAYSEFLPLDGAFRDNVIVQVKNGAIDFQPREPFHPLFGAMRKTPLMPEFQITKEYLGFSTHVAYLGSLFSETLQADTYARGKGSTVAKTVDGSLFKATTRSPLTGIAGVANIGADRNWSGSIFDQANWYAFGRLAWDPDLRPEAIAQEWVRMSFSNDSAVVTPVVDLLLRSREAVVNYMTPLGLHHLMGRGHHYGPAPWMPAASARTGTRCITTVLITTGLDLIAVPVAAMRLRNMPRRWRACSATCNACPSVTCCGSTTRHGTTAWPRGGRCGTSWCGITTTVWMKCSRCVQRGSSCTAASMRSVTSRSQRFWRSSRTRRSGGAMPALRISSRCPAVRCRLARRHRRIRWRTTRR